MMQLLRRILRDLQPAALLLGLAGAVFLVVSTPTPVKACWNIIEYQCFNVTEQDMPWPWTHPVGTGRQWRRFPAVPPPAPGVTWGFQDRIFDTHNCPDDAISLWCVGYPPSNDPQYNDYARGMDDYVTYGPFSLAGASAAMATFWIYNRSEAAHDSAFWGASTTPTLNAPATMNIAGVHSGMMVDGFQQREIDFSHLVNLASGDTVSLLGQAAVYVFWRFRSDANAVVNKGAFLDNVTIAWDDGGVDLISNQISVLRPDSSSITYPAIDDSMFARYSWTTCTGGAGVYPPFHVTGKVYSRVDTVTVLDTIVTSVVPGVSQVVYSHYWVNTSADSHWVRFKVDALNNVNEVDEANNSAESSYYIAPPIQFTDFRWITPGTEPDTVNTTAILRWEAHDVLEATLTFFTSLDTFSCSGGMIPGGNNIPVRGLDSLSWNVAALPQGRVIHPFVRVVNPGFDSCLYAPFPIVIRHSAVTDRPDGGVPKEFFLQQNYPNPFNPSTELRYGIAVGGQVTLRVYDVLGRQVVELVNAERAPGSYAVNFDGSHLATGLYLYTLTSPEGTQSRKMMLMK
jgi:hypothetical protein